jgi:hypothetical protein
MSVYRSLALILALLLPACENASDGTLSVERFNNRTEYKMSSMTGFWCHTTVYIDDGSDGTLDRAKRIYAGREQEIDKNSSLFPDLETRFREEILPEAEIR